MEMKKNSKGELFIVSAPSGAGKTSLVKSLTETLSDVAVSVSYTTRKKRSKEQEGVDYHFIDHETFTSMLEENAFLEHAKVFLNFYGTSSMWVEEMRSKGFDVVLEIDWQGARQVREQFPEAHSLFILPPSIEALLERLRKRHPGNEIIVQERMQEAKEQIARYNEYDYLVCNDEFEAALVDLKSIIQANRLHWRRQHTQQADLIKKLLS